MLVGAALIPWLSIPEGFLVFVIVVVVSGALAIFFLVKLADGPTLDMLRGFWRASRKSSPPGTVERD
jgi:hypothetical protein